MAEEIVVMRDDTQEPTSISSLKALADMLSSTMGVKLVAGNAFGYNRATATVTYDPSVINKMPGYLAAALIYHNVGHAVHSIPKTPLPDFSAEAAKRYTVRQASGKEQIPIAPQWVYNIIEAAEDERMESKLREEFQNLGATYLPRIDKGYRERAFLYQYKVLQVPGREGDHSHYWHRAGIAVRGLVSGAITADDLPSDMQWESDITDRIKSLRMAPTMDDLMHEIQDILGEIIEDHSKQEEISPVPSPGDKKGDGEGESKDANPSEAKESGGAKGSGKSSVDKEGEGGTPKPTEGKLPEDKKGSWRDEYSLDNLPDQRTEEEQKAWNAKLEEVKLAASKAPAHNCELEDCSKGAHEMKMSESLGSAMATAKWLKDMKASEATKGMGGGHGQARAIGDRLASGAPDWNTIVSTCDHMLRPVERAIKQKLRDNQTQEILSGFKAGARLNGRVLAIAEQNQDGRIFRRYATTGEKSYAIYLLYDISGSMSSCYPSIESFPGVYGHWDQQECTSQLRMAVSVIQGLRHFKEVQVGIGAYHDRCFPLKEVHEQLSVDKQNKIINRLLSPSGGNEDHMGMRMARHSLERVRADKKLIILMTDGGFCVSANQMSEEYDLAKKSGIESSIIIANHGPSQVEHVRAFYPGRNPLVVQSYEANLGATVGKLLDSIIKVKNVV